MRTRKKRVGGRGDRLDKSYIVCWFKMQLKHLVKNWRVTDWHKDLVVAGRLHLWGGMLTSDQGEDPGKLCGKWPKNLIRDHQDFKTTEVEQRRNKPADFTLRLLLLEQALEAWQVVHCLCPRYRVVTRFPIALATCCRDCCCFSTLNKLDR